MTTSVQPQFPCCICTSQNAVKTAQLVQRAATLS